MQLKELQKLRKAEISWATYCYLLAFGQNKDKTTTRNCEPVYTIVEIYNPRVDLRLVKMEQESGVNYFIIDNNE